MEAFNMSKNTRTQAESQMLISEFKQSGETKKSWCARNNLAQSRLSYYLSKDKNTANKTQSKVPQWIVADLPSSKNETPIEIRVGKISVIVHDNFDKAFFSEVVAELVKIC